MEVGACFDNFAAVKRAAADHASLNGYSFNLDKHDKKRLVLACRTTDCPYHLRAIIDCHSVCKITKLNFTHTCAGNLQEGRGSQNAKKWVAQAIHTGMVVNPKTAPKQIQDHMRMQHDDQREQFRKFRSYCAALKAADPQTTATVKASSISVPSILPDSPRAFA
ncbi:hypothetical protein PsorP6_017895 [Peronosclerospora sorghi]|uniref:Uncharacterized protein n=1 Tax=Peronosclerospora sorghi TaxID=230839 RepID=A0ACC0WCV6_9STRA|nr:hypothetical protein PsorP6_017895 [Peronosclerospora sorghi]